MTDARIEPTDRTAHPKHRWTGAKLLKRAAIGVVALTSIVSLSAWALYSSLDPTATSVQRLSNVHDWQELAALPGDHGDRTAVPNAASLRQIKILSAEATDQALTHFQTFGTPIPSFATLQISSIADPFYGTPTSPLDRIVQTGFSGVLFKLKTQLADGGFVESEAGARWARRLVRATEHAHWLKPKFTVLVEAPEEIVAHSGLLQRIDGLVKRHLLSDPFTHLSASNTAAMTASRHYLDRVTRSGKLVLVQETAQNNAVRHRLERRLRAFGYIPSIRLQPQVTTAKGASLRGG